MFQIHSNDCKNKSKIEKKQTNNIENKTKTHADLQIKEIVVIRLKDTISSNFHEYYLYI